MFIEYCNTYDDIAPELGHLPNAHRRQQSFPDVQFKHVPDYHFHRCTYLLTVIYDCALIIAELGAEMEGHLWRMQNILTYTHTSLLLVIFTVLQSSHY